jgi:ubiquinone/menaquinone biosynthesis C-methylase UbiE
MSNADLHRIRAFFGPRAADWERRVAKDAAQIERAVNEANLRTGMTVLELGCGTAPAAPWLRAAVGPGGRVIAVDVTPEMIGQARRAGRGAVTGLVIADVHLLPIAVGTIDALHAGGIVPHLADPERALRDWARVARRGALLSVFHAIGRTALAAIHSRAPSDDDVIAPARVGSLLERTGWRVASIDDAPERYLALARRAD